MAEPRASNYRQLLRIALLCGLAFNPDVAVSWCLSPFRGTGQAASLRCRSSRLPMPLLAMDGEDRHDYWEEDDYWKEDDFDASPEQEDESSGRGFGIYDVKFDGSLSEEELVWERCPTEVGDCSVLLPPRSVERPSAVIHFTGGTFFGSAPSLWYKELLEDIVRHTQAAVVATSIPVTLLQSPLEHLSLARKLQRQFQTAWMEVLLDEYGDESMSEVPVCGIGHSLGARLMVVLATLGPMLQREQGPSLPPEYKSYVLISFTNFGASAGIPGISQLQKARRRIEKQEEEDDSWSQKQRRRKRRNYKDWIDDEDDEDDEDWVDLFQELQESLGNEAARVQAALTPKELEFYPAPDKLWKALNNDKRYRIPQTLIVQFDDDEVDQSSKLALALTEVSDVKFARLRGTHLTPISVQGAHVRGNNMLMEELNSGIGRTLFKLLSGRQESRSGLGALRDLRQTIARYTTEIVTKDPI